MLKMAYLAVFIKNKIIFNLLAFNIYDKSKVPNLSLT